jgi:hypothetical protein
MGDISCFDDNSFNRDNFMNYDIEYNIGDK